MNLELARGAGSRYLVQRWGDGTFCDKMGRKREVEIQVSSSRFFPAPALPTRPVSSPHTPVLVLTPPFPPLLLRRRASSTAR